uniref:Uncharacterized protein n=1 Tax=viral metagenome TaxID=1070528 RepID=A0A6H1ZX11_9ZZZZ
MTEPTRIIEIKDGVLRVELDIRRTKPVFVQAYLLEAQRLFGQYMMNLQLEMQKNEAIKNKLKV